MNQGYTFHSALPERITPRSAGDSVYEDMRSRILRLELPPDTILSRNDLCQHYSVSLSPIREALQALEQDGLVHIRPQSSTMVTRIDQKQLRQTQFLRVAVETELVRRLAENPPPATVTRAQAIIDMQATLAGDLDQMDLFSELDRSFHHTLFEGAGVEEIYHMVARRLGHLARCQRLELPHSGKMDSIVAAHRDVLAGISTRNPEAAATAMRLHLTGTINRIEGLQDKHPEFFT